jgi:mono/diheme cytochrome c family protein
MRRLIMLAAATYLLTIAAAMAQDEKPHGSSWIVPQEANARTNPLPNQPVVVAGGQKLFGQRCAVCHAKDGTGTNRGPNLTARHVQDQSDGALFWKISSGNTRTGMPTFSFLPESQRWQLVMQIRALAE